MRWLWVLVGLLQLLGCATPLQHGSHCLVESEYLSDQSSFSWVESGAIELIDESGAISPAIVEQLKRAVIDEMRLKGYEFVPRQGDSPPAEVTVGLYFLVRREATASSLDTIQPCTYPNCWRAPHDERVRLDIRTIGFLAADLYFQGKPIWRGWVERILNPSERDAASQVIGEAVPLLLDDFPS